MRTESAAARRGGDSRTTTRRAAPRAWSALTRAQAAAFARYATLDADSRALAAAAVAVAAASVAGRGGGRSWEQLRPGRVAARLAALGRPPRREAFALLWGFFQFLATTGRMEPTHGRYLAAYFQTLTELEDLRL